jgi:hypothetical protein
MKRLRSLPTTKRQLKERGDPWRLNEEAPTAGALGAVASKQITSNSYEQLEPGTTEQERETMILKSNIQVL